MLCADWCMLVTNWHATILGASMFELSVKAATAREPYTQCFWKIYRFLSVTQLSRVNALPRCFVLTGADAAGRMQRKKLNVTPYVASLLQV